MKISKIITLLVLLSLAVSACGKNLLNEKSVELNIKSNIPVDDIKSFKLTFLNEKENIEYVIYKENISEDKIKIKNDDYIVSAAIIDKNDFIVAKGETSLLKDDSTLEIAMFE